MKKKLLYIAHAYHKKTKSNNFLQDLIKEQYDVEVFSFDPFSDDENIHFAPLLEQNGGRKKVDVLVLFQIMPKIDLIKKYVEFNHGAFFPMYDMAKNAQDADWLGYKDFNIINFSKTLNEKLIGLGLSSYYIQYFPKPHEKFDLGDKNSIFFWQRLGHLNVNTVETLFQKRQIEHIHVHKAIDPGHEFVEPLGKIKKACTYSTWYQRREDYLKDIERAVFYIAPREFEGIGMSFLEAMALGRCVVSPDNPTMNEYIINGKTGILYDLNKPVAIDFSKLDIEQIQKNTYEYIKEGYKRWRIEKYNILNWLEATVNTNNDILAINCKKMPRERKKHYLLGFIPFMFIEKYEKHTSCRFLGCIPILKIIEKRNKTKYCLFGIIPVWKRIL